MKKYLFFLVLSSILLVFCFCAKQGFPPGGPVDKTPPEIIATFPVCNSTGVNPQTQIRITFSERMDRDAVEKSVRIFPFLGVAPEMHWKGRKLIIKPLRELSVPQTYVVTVGTEAQDGQGNHLVKPYCFAFSTGKQIDSGEINGRVITVQGPQPGAVIWAYRLSSAKDPDPARDTPQYGTETDQNGEYLFRFLHPGVYRIFSFLDKDRNGEYTPEQDPLAVPPMDVTLTDSVSSARLPDLFPVVRDTTRPRLISIDAPDRTHLRLTFDEEVDLSTAKISIVGKDTLPILAKYTLPGEEKRVYLLTDPQQSESYKLISEGICDLWGNPLIVSSEALFFGGSSVPDTLPPRVVSVFPKDNSRNVFLNQPIEIRFSEAMSEVIPEGFLRSSDQLPAGELFWKDPVTLEFLPSNSWKSAHRYCIDFALSLLADYAGNSCSDSLYALCFTTVNEDTLGFIAGRLETEILPAGTDVYLTLRKTNGKTEYRFQPVITNGRYLTEGVLPGVYFVSAFEDRNGNGRQDFGRIHPFSPAEMVTCFPNKVRVRSRWTTERIDLRF